MQPFSKVEVDLINLLPELFFFFFFWGGGGGGGVRAKVPIELALGFSRGEESFHTLLRTPDPTTGPFLGGSYKAIGSSK